MKRVREYKQKQKEKQYNIRKVYRFWWTKAKEEEKEYRLCFMWRLKYNPAPSIFKDTKAYFSLDKFPTLKSLTDFLDNDDFWRLQKN